MTRRSLLWRSSVWIAGSAIGAVIVAQPDADDRVFSISETHGPAPLDLLGVAVLIGSWAPIALLLPCLCRAAGSVAGRLAAGLAVVGTIGLMVSISADTGREWLLAVAALVAAQLVLLADGWRAAGSGPLSASGG